jgi:hypothetical protein
MPCDEEKEKEKKGHVQLFNKSSDDQFFEPYVQLKTLDEQERERANVLLQCCILSHIPLVSFIPQDTNNIFSL